MSIQKGTIGSYTAGEALAIHRAVRLSAGSGTSVVYADATHEAIGITQNSAASGFPVDVKHLNAPGTFKVVAAGAFSIGDTLYPAADGKWDDTLVDGAGAFQALEAATANNDVIEAIPLASVNLKGSTGLAYSNTASSTSHENTTTAADLDVTYTIDGAKLEVGDVIEVVASVWVEDQNATDTLTMLLKLGTETIASTGAIDVADNDLLLIHAWIHVAAVGASGSVRAHGIIGRGPAGTGPNSTFYKAAATEDISGDTEIAVNLDWSAASADNEAELWGLFVKVHKR